MEERSRALPFVYISVFLPACTRPTWYFFNSFWFDFLLPISCSLLVCMILFRILSGFLNRYLKTHRREIALIGLVLLISVSARGILQSAGLDPLHLARRLAGSLSVPVAVVRVYRLALIIFPCFLLYLFLRIISKKINIGGIVQLLSTVGYAFLCIGIFNISKIQLHKHESTQGNISQTLQNRVNRRVVWVIFDELDYRLSIGDQAKQYNNSLENFNFLANNALSASNAISPSDNTLAALPGLLIGEPFKGVRTDGPGILSMIKPDNSVLEFSESNTVFGDLHSQGKLFSIMGFFHPYCAIFKNAHSCYGHCTSNNTVDRFGALLHPIPESLIDFLSPMFVTTSEQMAVFPELIKQEDDALTFLHFNVPHMPANYAFKHFGAKPSLDFQAQYSANLKFTDQILGQIIDLLKKTKRSPDTLLIVSGDHGFRVMNKTQNARTVPLLAWIVGTQERTPIFNSR